VAVPLLHGRLLPLALLVAASPTWRLGIALRRRLGSGGQRRLALPLLLLTLAVPLGLVALWWGARFLPLTALSVRLSPAYLRSYFSPAFLGHYLSGILLDRATGILPAAPVLILAGAGIAGLLRHAPRYGLWTAGLIGAQLGVVALRASGWEAWGPPGRYILPIVPLLGLAVAAAWGTVERLLHLAGAVLAAWGLIVAVFISWIPLTAYYFPSERKWFGDPLVRDWLGGNPLAIFPFIPAGVPFGWPQVLPWLALFALVTLIGALPLPRSGPVER